MNIATIFLLLILLPVCVCASDLYQIRPLSELEVVTTYETMLRDACRYSEKDWHEWSADPSGGYWGNAISGGNEGIRAISQMVLVSGALLRYCPDLTNAERDDYLKKATAAIRYTAATHKTGTQKCTDGKQWGGDWQSAMWTGTLAFGAWLMWDKLDAELQKDVERVVSSEADGSSRTSPRQGDGSTQRLRRTAGRSSASPPLQICFPITRMPLPGTRRPSNT